MTVAELLLPHLKPGHADVTLCDIQQESNACSLSTGRAPAQLDTHSLKIILCNSCSSTTKCSMRKIPPFPGMNSL